MMKTRLVRTARSVGNLFLIGTSLGACGASNSPTPPPTTVPTAAPTAVVAVSDSAVASTPGITSPPASVADAATTAVPGGPVLPVAANLITNQATALVLKIESVRVENNVDSFGKAADDHLEIALRNTGSTELTDIEVFSTFTDATAGTTESYYADLPSDFTIPAGGMRIIHFDDTGAPDHFAVNKFSLFATSTNGLDVDVVVSAKDAAVQRLSLKKDPGGAEAAD